MRIEKKATILSQLVVLYHFKHHKLFVFNVKINLLLFLL